MKRLPLIAHVGLLVILFTATACQQRNDIIDRSVDPFWEKSYFQDDKSWYFDSRVVEVAPNQGFIGPGYSGDHYRFHLDRIRWEITESHLIGYRDYAFTPGTNDGGNVGFRDEDAENDGDIPSETTNPGGDDAFFGEPIIALPIASHFDRIRGYVGLTGEQTNEIVENETDRPWYERDYFRVDWSAADAVKFYNIATVTDEESYQDIADPRRWRFDLDEGYFEFTNRYIFQGDIYNLLGWTVPGFGYQFDDVAADVRFSFRRIDEPSDYIPLNYPETMVMVDEDGDEIRDENGLSQRTPIGDRFGYFTVDREEFDPRRGQTEFNKLERIIRFNIWEEWKDEDGEEIPLEDRTPKPVIWYPNVDHPVQLLQASYDAIAAWNKIFKEFVMEVQPGKYDAMSDVPDMFILRPNSCSVDNVKGILSGLNSEQLEAVTTAAAHDYISREFDGTIESVEARLDDLALYDEDGNFQDPIVDLATFQSAETAAFHDLERICTALEWVTRHDEGLKDDPANRFTYQRVGDIRFHMLNTIPEYFDAGWSGLGTIKPDPVTGEEVHGTANIAVQWIDRAAYTYNEAIQGIKGEIEIFDVTTSVDVKAYVDEQLRRWRAAEEGFTGASDGRLTERVRTLQSNGQLREQSPHRNQARMSRIAGTALEQRLVSPELETFWANQVGQEEIDAADGSLQEAILNKASPARNGLKERMTREDIIREMGQRAMDSVELIDQFAVGLSSEYALIENPRERFFKIRSDYYFGVMTHEIGHTLALRHNFGASMDALNYDDRFWDLQRLPKNPEDALSALCDDYADEFGTAICDELADIRDLGDVDDLELDADQRDAVEDILILNACIQDMPESVTDGESAQTYYTENCFGVERYMVSTTMEYPGPRTSRVGALGKYDKAAVFFGYGQLVEVLDEPVQDMTEKEGDSWLRHNDWRTIPGSFVQDYGSLDERSFVKYDWENFQAEPLPTNAVPYRYCGDSYRDIWCAPSDFGADFQQMQTFNEYKYFSRYFFTHFNRDRYWDIQNNDWTGPIFSDFNVIDWSGNAMKWFAYLASFDPDFDGSYLQSDLEKTTYRGLNMLSHILAHPRNGRFIQFQQYKTAGLHLLDHYDLVLEGGQACTENGECASGQCDLDTNLCKEGRATDFEWSDASPVLAPWTWVDNCDWDAYIDGQQLSQNRDTGSFNYPQEALLDGVAGGIVPLGDGRPTYYEYTGPEYEDLIVNYIGSFWAKDYVLQDLVWTGTGFPRTDYVSDPRNFAISWYSLFPEEVGEIFRAVITEEEWRLGGTVDDEGNFYLPDLFDPETGDRVDLNGEPRVLPSFVRSHIYNAMLYADALATNLYDGAFDINKAMMVTVDGAQDDHAGLDPSNTVEDVIEYIDPISGLKYQALDYEPLPIAADMLRKATVFAQRYEDLTQCEEDLRPIVRECSTTVNTLAAFEDCVEQGKEDAGVETPRFCGCYTGDRLTESGDFGCQDLRHLDVGAPACTFESLEDRADAARESLLFWTDTLNYMREMNWIFGW